MFVLLVSAKYIIYGYLNKIMCSKIKKVIQIDSPFISYYVSIIKKKNINKNFDTIFGYHHFLWVVLGILNLFLDFTHDDRQMTDLLVIYVYTDDGSHYYLYEWNEWHVTFSLSYFQTLIIIQN